MPNKVKYLDTRKMTELSRNIFYDNESDTFWYYSANLDSYIEVEHDILEDLE